LFFHNFLSAKRFLRIIVLENFRPLGISIFAFKQAQQRLLA